MNSFKLRMAQRLDPGQWSLNRLIGVIYDPILGLTVGMAFEFSFSTALLNRVHTVLMT